MDYLRQTIDSKELGDIFRLPQTLQNRKVEVIILPADIGVTVRKDFKGKSSFGCLKKYANLNLIQKEEGAWAQATVIKYANS